MNFHIKDIESVQEPGDQDVLLTVWLPSEDLSCHRVAIPTAPKRKWSELLPWLLEERLLNEVSTLHFVNAGKAGDKELCVLIAAKSKMQIWQDSLKKAGIDTYLLLPDYLALPWQKGMISIGQRDEFILVRYGEVEGFAAEPELAWPLLDRILAEADQNTGLMLSLPDALVPPSLHERIKNRKQGINWQTAQGPQAANLATGPYAVSASSALSFQWLPTAALLLLALLSSYAFLRLDNYHLQNEIAVLEQENRDAVSQFFPGLTVRGGNIRDSVEDFIAFGFQQRESLAVPGMTLLMNLDRSLRECNCALEAVHLDADEASLVLASESAARLRQLEIQGYSKDFQQRENESLTELILRQEPRP